MNREERFTEKFLKSEGHTSIAYEPDGNTPPDFSVDAVTAVEVRRLNQNYKEPDGSMRGLEEDDIPLLMTVRNVLAEFGSPVDERTWLVSYCFKRPLSPLGEIAENLREWLATLDLPGDERREATLPCGLQVRISPAGRTYESRFVLGMTSDGDSGGWVLSELERNIQICVNEKSSKVASHLNRYDEWWLALVDYIGFGLSAFEQELFADRIDVPDPWSKIIIVNPVSPLKSFELR